MFYLALAIGAQSNTHKKMYAFVSYIAIIVILQLLSSLFASLGFSLDVNSLLVGTELQSFAYSALFALIWDTCAATVLSILFFLGTEYLMRKKLNLE